MYASDLESTAYRYDSKKSDFDSAESNFESTCGSYGYSRGNEFACGQFGYIREEYRRAADELENAASQLKSVISDVALFCGMPDENPNYLRDLVKAAKENEELKKRVLQLEQEIERYRNAPRHTEGSPSLAK